MRLITPLFFKILICFSITVVLIPIVLANSGIVVFVFLTIEKTMRDRVLPNFSTNPLPNFFTPFSTLGEFFPLPNNYIKLMSITHRCHPQTSLHCITNKLSEVTFCTSFPSISAINCSLRRSISSWASKRARRLPFRRDSRAFICF